MNILFIWDQCGAEPIEFYLATGAAAELAAQCNGQYINDADIPDDAAIYKLHAQFFYSDTGKKRKPQEEFRLLRPDELAAPSGPFDMIVLAGFLP